jgi:hypothetical protein
MKSYLVSVCFCSFLSPHSPRMHPCSEQTWSIPASIAVQAFRSWVKWKFQTGGRVISSPAVENELVYVGSTDKNLYAVDHQTGALKWKFATDGPVVSSPAAAGIVISGATTAVLRTRRGDRPVETEN